MIHAVQLPEGINREDYWIIFPKGVSWYYTMQELLRSLGDDLQKKPHEMLAFLSATDMGEPVYFFKKSRFPVEVIMKKTGMSKEAIEKAEYLTLVETSKPGVPLPNVDYWGRA